MQTKISQPENTPLSTYYLPKETISPTLNDKVQPTNKLIAVHIIGCITNPGVYYMPTGSLLIDIINEAGGFTTEADTQVANLAYLLSGGMQIRIPAITDTDKTWLIAMGTSLGTDSLENEPRSKININTATLSELMTLSGIGESSAKSIIAYREEHGKFKNINDIMNVPGIKEGKFNKIKDDICISS